MSKIKICLAVADGGLAALIRAQLKRSCPGAEVTVARTEPDLFEQVAAWRPHAVVLEEDFGEMSPARLIGQIMRSCTGLAVVLIAERSPLLPESQQIAPAAATQPHALWQRIETALESAQTAATTIGGRSEISERAALERRLLSGGATSDSLAPVTYLLLEVDERDRGSGHRDPALDELLVHGVASVLRSKLPSGAMTARWGQRRFLALFEQTGLADAWIWAEGARQRIEQSPLKIGDREIELTASIGLASLAATDLGVDALELAEAALELASAQDEHRICTWDWVEIDAMLTAVAGQRNLDLERRRHEFLARCAYLLGPNQRHHVSAHCAQVSDVARRLADVLELSDDDIARIRVAGLLHDIGKCVIPEQLLAKPSSLSLREWMIMGQHAAIGADMARHLGADEETAQCVLHHHARFDAERISAPIGGRILAVADALVTMSSPRVYGRTRPAYESLAELSRESGRQFDPIVVAAALRVGPGFLTRAA